MCSSPRNPISHPDPAARAGTVIGLIGVLAGFVPLLGWEAMGPRPGDMELFPETALRLTLAPTPAVAPAPPEPPKTEPADAPRPELESEPVIETPAIPPAPAAAEQPPVETPGEAGREDAIREEWFSELRRRIEENKFYPGSARFSEQTGTVTLRVRISAGAEILGSEIAANTGAERLAEGAQAILRRAATRPLGTNRLSTEIQVQVPITYRMAER
ncbi:MAG: TonB family protein [Kiritimatiellae bacterium]|nr:TonB family protein [Kiritimatiellia bacterium]